MPVLRRRACLIRSFLSTTSPTLPVRLVSSAQQSFFNTEPCELSDANSQQLPPRSCTPGHPPASPPPRPPRGGPASPVTPVRHTYHDALLTCSTSTNSVNVLCHELTTRSCRRHCPQDASRRAASFTRRAAALNAVRAGVSPETNHQALCCCNAELPRGKLPMHRATRPAETQGRS